MNKLEEQFLPYQQSMNMKELGFNEPCFGHYRMKLFYLKEYRKQGNGITLRPLYQQAFRWFREKHYLHCTVSRVGYYGYSFVIEDEHFHNNDGYTYEEAEVACLNKLIEIVKTKKL
jgi:hypothetical protein